jgi:hypothetical protein
MTVIPAVTTATEYVFNSIHVCGIVSLLDYIVYLVLIVYMLRNTDAYYLINLLYALVYRN